MPVSECVVSIYACVYLCLCRPQMDRWTDVSMFTVPFQLVPDFAAQYHVVGGFSPPADLLCESIQHQTWLIRPNMFRILYVLS